MFNLPRDAPRISFPLSSADRTTTEGILGTTEVNGISVAFDDKGHSDRVVLLVHGHPFDRSMWAPQIEAIEHAGWRVIAPDLRGYGESSPAAGTTTLDQFARDIAALLTRCGVGRVALGGLSRGARSLWSSA